MANRIKDDSGDRKYWVQTPMLIWALSQDPYDLALWFTIKAVAGEDRECTLTTEDLATLSMMSMGKVSQCRSRLIELGLLQGELRKDPDYPQPVWHLTIPDIWETNVVWAKEYASIKARIEHKSLQRSELQSKRSAARSLHQVKDTPKEPSPGEEGVTPGEEGVTPGEEGVTPGEEGVTPGETNKIIYRIDLDQAKITEEGARVSDPARAEPPTPPTPPATPPSETATATATAKTRMGSDDYDHPGVTAKATPPSSGRPSPRSPHIDGRKFVGGRIPAGTGANAVEVFYERYSINQTKLSAPKEDDLIAAVTDLGRWRAVVVAWEQSDYKPTNIKGQLDWYREGIPERNNGAGNGTGFGLTAYAEKERKQYERDYGPDEELTPEKEQWIWEQKRKLAERNHNTGV